MNGFSSHKVSAHVFKEFAVKHIMETLEWVWIRSVLDENKDDKKYRQAWSFDVLSPHSITEYKNQAKLWTDRICEAYPSLTEQVSPISAQMETINSGNLTVAYHTYMSSISTLFGLTRQVSSAQEPNDEYAAITIQNDSNVVFKIKTPENNTKGFVHATTELVKIIRAEQRWPTVEEYCCINVACEIFNLGNALQINPVAWKAPGFRKHQTLMSITDPGTGHLHGTCLVNSYLDGVIVHIEHLERGVKIPRAEIEPYRIPSPKMIPRICLWVSGAAPVSTYVGRPMFDGEIEQSMLKTVHTYSAACNDFFASGVTECKVAIEGMTSSQAIRFLRSLSSNIRRNNTKQILSTAFCINDPMVDDRDGTDKLVTDRYEIGLLGIDIAKAAGIEKVTWDGAADTYPSRCIVEQLSFKETVSLVHAAHENGLLTYFSAGFRFNHIKLAVWAGVDGIGIGGAQVLRYMDYENGNHGPFKPDNIDIILGERDDAEFSVPGRAAKLLARLDQMYFEHSITQEQDKMRKELFESLCLLDNEQLQTILSKLLFERTLPDDDADPVISSAKRVLLLGDRESNEHHAKNDLLDAINAEDSAWAHFLLRKIPEALPRNI